MDDNQLDAIKFAINEKAIQALESMNKYDGNDNDLYNFYKGQYLAYCETYSMLKNS